MKRLLKMLGGSNSTEDAQQDSRAFSGLPSGARDLSRVRMPVRNRVAKPLMIGALVLTCGYTALSVAFPGYATLPSLKENELHLFMVAAVDRDCDGELSDEAEEDSTFGTRKTLLPAQCLVYRTMYRNDGDFDIRHVRVTNVVPGQMVYIDGSAEHVATPPGLWPEISVAPSETIDGSLIWRFGGALAPGEKGEIQFRVRLQP